MQITTDFSDLGDFAEDVRDVDPKAARRRAMRSAMETLLDYILEEIRSEGLFGFQTPGNRGEGPALATRAAWEVTQVQDGVWRIKVDERVADRAVYLEFGTDGPITPNDADRLKFESQDGEMIYPKAVSGVEEYAFLRTALKRYRAENVLQNEFKNEIEREFTEALGI